MAARVTGAVDGLDCFLVATLSLPWLISGIFLFFYCLQIYNYLKYIQLLSRFYFQTCRQLKLDTINK